MPLFGRAHECKEYEQWSEKKVWKMSGMKWTLSNNKGDPQKDVSETWIHSGQQMNKKCSNPKRKGCLKMPLKPHWGPRLPLRRLQKWLERPYQRWVMVEPLKNTRKNVSKGDSLCELHENAKCRVPNNMTEICVMIWKDYVMCIGRRSLEEHDEQAISTK